MSSWMKNVVIVLGVVALSGCAGKSADSFTLEVDLPADFELKTAANYRPATGAACSLPMRRGKRPERKVFFTEFNPVANRVSYELPLSETIEGCPSVISSVQFDVYAKWGKQDWDVGGDLAGIGIRDRLAGDLPGMPEDGVQELKGQCRWYFRTIGPMHAIIKILQCHSLDAAGQPQKMQAGGVAQRDQLRGKKLRMVLKVLDEELPAFDHRWIAVPGGWKRCRGKSFEDMAAYCTGNDSEFKPVKMPDGRICDVYPTCHQQGAN
ncbi:hypothetical protein ACQRBV_25740 [Pseudomonas sp. R11F]|uniref:hypothetical protein n=1 Tax=Pseudomonas TaxID=286 RepID=UPI001FD2F2E6|nr:hypothetical protein [Pseudomonas palleroniana]UOP09535.1 hypothetical protein LDL65_20920 [Pseudomonas palleroniana]